MKSISLLLSDFQSFEGYFEGDKVRKKYFEQNFSNTDKREVMLKISAIKVPFLVNLIPDLTHLAAYICSCNIDEKLKHGDPDVVTLLTGFFSEGSAPSGFITFCSAYCCWHNESAYPIENIRALDLLENTLHVAKDECRSTYKKFKRYMTALRSQLGLEALDFQELDKFFWVYTDELDTLKPAELTNG